jgi:DNA-binding HxlR family transcriptional regulator
MENALDEYCERIFSLLMVTNTEYRFNKLQETLTDFGAKMSAPTLIKHLKHLQKRGFIKQKIENRQNISYRVNWKKLETLKDGLKITQTINQNKKHFKSLPLDDQIVTLTSIFALGDLLYLKLYVLDILEPNKKPEHRFTYIFMNKLLDTYRLWLLDTCKESKENSQKALTMIQRAIDGFQNELFAKKPKSPA